MINNVNVSGTVYEISAVENASDIMCCYIHLNIAGVRVKVACKELLAMNVVNKIKLGTQVIVIGQLGYVGNSDQEIGVIASAVVQDDTVYPKDYPKEVLTREISEIEHQAQIVKAINEIVDDEPF